MRITERTSIHGTVVWLVHGHDGQLKRAGRKENLITQIGDQMYADRALNIGTPPAAPIGMKLGTGATAPAKTGAGAALGAYLSGSNLLFDAGYPQSGLNSNARRIAFRCTFVPGVATSSTPITEAVLFNNTNADSASTAANTIARVLITPGAKDTLDTLTLYWYHDLLGV